MGPGARRPGRTPRVRSSPPPRPPRASASSATRSSPVAPPCPTSPRSIPPFVDRAAPSPFASSVAAPYPTSLTRAHATSPLLSLSPIRPVLVCAHLQAVQWRHAVMVADEEGAPVQRMAIVAQSHVGGRRLRSMAEERVGQGSGQSSGSTAAVVLCVTGPACRRSGMRGHQHSSGGEDPQDLKELNCRLPSPVVSSCPSSVSFCRNDTLLLCFFPRAISGVLYANNKNGDGEETVLTYFADLFSQLYDLRKWLCWIALKMVQIAHSGHFFPQGYTCVARPLPCPQRIQLPVGI